MNFKEYSDKVLVTKSGNYEKIHDRLSSEKSIDLIHAIMGLSTEVGELIDNVKKHIFYGKELDVVNIKEEGGDVCWYLSLLLKTLDINFEDMLKTNHDKLRARYGDKFSEERAINRDLGTEREILEK